jgi:hypothetical protein
MASDRHAGHDRAVAPGLGEATLEPAPAPPKRRPPHGPRASPVGGAPGRRELRWGLSAHSRRAVRAGLPNCGSTRLQHELARLARYPLLVIDEVGYIPFEPEAANLFFQLVSSRYERASLIVTSNKPFGRWGEVFGDDVVAAAMIDRLVHHAEVIALKGDGCRLKNRDLGRVPTTATDEP